MTTTTANLLIGDRILSMSSAPDAIVKNVRNDLGDVLVQTDRDGTTRYPSSAPVTVVR